MRVKHLSFSPYEQVHDERIGNLFLITHLFLTTVKYSVHHDELKIFESQHLICKSLKCEHNNETYFCYDLVLVGIQFICV